MKSAEPGRGKPPGTLSCGAAAGAQRSAHPVLLLALLGLLGVPAARSEYGDDGEDQRDLPRSHLCCSGAGEGDATTPNPLLDALRDALRDAALPGAFAWRESLGKPSHTLGMLIGEGAREWGPHLRRSSPAAGDCGPPPRMTHSRPSSDEQASSFPVGSRVTYRCIEGTIKIPGRSDTVVCLPGARWSQLPEPCGRKYLLSLKLRSLLCLSLGLKFLPFPAAALQWHHLSRPGTNPAPRAADGCGIPACRRGGPSEGGRSPGCSRISPAPAARAGGCFFPAHTFACAVNASSAAFCKRCSQQGSSPARNQKSAAMNAGSFPKAP